MKNSGNIDGPQHPNQTNEWRQITNYQQLQSSNMTKVRLMF